ncbi:MAG: polysaccharide deacetylase family protein [Saprospiraceae bacterium]|nr:polysaccharide deacetylase family protein [Candidatus Parvibacillus calidus]MBX2935722.1 polysaccharide deacetylase family protein [Saprospiraceae bacterium]MBX7179046.1 polysaccharide deacetylase family protein [Saprospiraceae bacterium]MCB0590637.1 polysaccharide deacetylase family protein [Saprospiraceae bacterium]MCO5284569.1 polysaccharide deacetylase family protein [Saprospiraceae bacterium]
MYLVKTPSFVKRFIPLALWGIRPGEKKIFLTFDDGPIPEVTPWVLDRLDEFDAKATFFCVGENIHKHPEVFNDVIERGHGVGSHTYNHLNGWETDNLEYLLNVKKAAQMSHSVLFRPPYGKLKPKQAQFLHKHYQIVMWDVLSGDFDQNISKEQVYKNVVNNAVDGSIIVFHDSLKAKERMEYALPRVLEYFSEKGFSFAAIQENEAYSPALVPQYA